MREDDDNSAQGTAKRRKNANDEHGNPRTCLCCGSVFHFIKDCPDSYENRGEAEEGFVAVGAENEFRKEDDQDVVVPVLYAGNKNELSLFTKEAMNAGALDTACTSTIAGETWMERRFT